MIRKTTHSNHLGCLQGHWPVHLANKDILFGIIDDCLVSESFMFHCTESECLMCWLEGRFNCDDLVFYTINYLGSYCDVFLRFQYIDSEDPSNNKLVEVHLTCKTL